MKEERLRAPIVQRGSSALAVSAWRGASGLRYVVGVHPAEDFGPEEAAEAVCIAVERDKAGIARLLSVGTGMAASDAERWLRQARKAGASEIHVHRLCDGPAERSAVAADLQPE